MIKIEEWSDEQITDGCSFSVLIDKIYKDVDPQMGFEKHLNSKDNFLQWQQDFRAKIIELLGIADLLKNRPDPVIIKGDPDQCMDKGSYRIEHFYLKSWYDTLIPVLLTVPKYLNPGQKVPAFVCTHGHGQSKYILNGLIPQKEYPNSHWAQDLAEIGYITISMDQWGWFERGFGGKYNSAEGSYAHKMLMIGRTINGLRFYNAIQQVDYLLTRPDVDPQKIGIGGLSLGGTTATWTAGIDTRIKMALIAGYLNNFKESIIDYNHCSCNYIPGLSLYGEMYDIAALIAPRPVCYICGIKDTTFYINPARDAFNRVKKAYKLLNAEDKCVKDEPNMGHDWNGTVAYPFVKKWFLS